MVRRLPGRVIIDNAKCAIIKACRYEPAVQRPYAALAEGYGFRIDACPLHDPAKKGYASYCTLCCWWNRDKRRLGRTVAAPLSFDQDDVADGLIETAMQITVAMLTQQPTPGPQVDASRADAELCGEFVGCQHASFAQALEPALEPVGGAYDVDLLVRERFAFPVCIAERIELSNMPVSDNCAREFAASIGLVPRQYSTGGKANLLGISKRGDSTLRRLLVQCARVIMQHLENRWDRLGDWLRSMLIRRHPNVVACALANKLARIAWAMMAHEPYRPVLVQHP